MTTTKAALLPEDGMMKLVEELRGPMPMYHAEERAIRMKAAAEVERLQEATRAALKVADERTMQNAALRQENERLLALTTRLRTAAEGVCWFDWSNNDQDAVEAITELRLALEQAPQGESK